MMDASQFQYGTPFCRNQLEGILNDCIQVYKVVLASSVKLNNKENEIRDELAKYLQTDDYKARYTTTVCNYHVDTEVHEGDHGRTDIRFLQVRPYAKQSTYFTVECKRLDGNAFLNREYVENGIRRFTTLDKYKTPLGYNAMMGFLITSSVVAGAYAGINSQLAPEERLTVLFSYGQEGYYEFVSSHKNSRVFTLFHLWMDFSSCIAEPN